MIAPPVLVAWWPLMLHQLVWLEAYRRFAVEFPQRDFWTDAGLVIAFRAVIPYVAARVISSRMLHQSAGKLSDSLRALLFSFAGGLFCIVALWLDASGTNPVAHETFPWAWALMGFWAGAAAAFWRDFAHRQKSPEAHGFREGFAEGVLIVGRYIYAEKKKIGAAVFGRADHPSDGDIETAGLV